MAKEKRNIECQVVRSGFVMGGSELPVGEVIQLSERQVVAFVGKIKTIKELKATEVDGAKSLKGLIALKEDNAKLADEVTDLEEEIAALKKSLSESKAPKK